MSDTDKDSEEEDRLSDLEHAQELASFADKLWGLSAAIRGLRYDCDFPAAVTGVGKICDLLCDQISEIAMTFEADLGAVDSHGAALICVRRVDPPAGEIRRQTVGIDFIPGICLIRLESVINRLCVDGRDTLMTINRGVKIKRQHFPSSIVDHSERSRGFTETPRRISASPKRSQADGRSSPRWTSGVRSERRGCP
jgi:hypothetical protein